MAASGRKLGNLTINRAVEMVMPFDRSFFFPEITPEDWAPHEGWLKPRAIDPESGNLLFTVQSYLVRTSHHTILVDSCVGNHKERPARPAWHQKSDDTYLRSLAALGVAPEEVDLVLCTHLHADHVGWNTRLVDGRWVPTFPNARYLFSKMELAAWEGGGHEKFSTQPLQDSVLPVIAAGRAELVASDHTLNDEVWLAPTPGHTPGHFSVNLSSGGERAVMCGDVMHSPVQCRHPTWHPWPDWDPDLAARTRRAFLEEHAESGALVCTAHFPLPSAGRVVAEGHAFRFVDDDVDW